VFSSFSFENAYALRTALFPSKIRDRSAIWKDQDRIFNAESETEKLRPLWIHSGDSIATAWSNSESLRDLLLRAEHSEIPQAGSVPDLFAHAPHPDHTWYAGTYVRNGGLFQYLEAYSRTPWVLISTALAGATFSQHTPHTLKSIGEIKNLHRAKLLTVSLGGNDICSSQNPFNDPESDPRKLFADLSSKLPAATTKIAFVVPPVDQVFQMLKKELESQPDSIAKSRVEVYCQEMWQTIMCPAIKEDSGEIAKTRLQMISAYRDAGFHLLDLAQAASTWNVQDLLSSDCFHPSRKLQRLITDETAKLVEATLFRED
jgi:lysophospholipase L1-like esterase